MLIIFLWPSALPYGLVWGGVGWRLRGLWNPFSSAAQEEGFSTPY